MKRSRRSGKPGKLTSRIIARLVKGDAAPAELAQQLGLTLAQLAEWASTPEHLRQLRHLARLADIRTQMLVAQYRTNAALQLFQIAGGKEAAEISRKACVDLLNADLDAFRDIDGNAKPESAPAPRQLQKLMQSLDRLGQAELDAAGRDHNAPPGEEKPNGPA